jgi:2-polyprenyl-3-methyl-5-hydroxy-6-metoxy-1,4-benzoquinol methylase
MAGCTACNCTKSTLLYTMKGFDLVKCEDCGLAYVINPPDEAYLNSLYSAENGNYHTQLFDEDSKEAQRMARVADVHMRFVEKVAQRGRLVDIGCSTGSFLERADQAGFSASGVEYSRDSARVAALRTGLNIETGGIHQCRLSEGSIDVLTMFDVIEHVPDPAEDLARAFALLRPGGWLVLSTPNIDGLFPRASQPLAKVLNYWPHPEAPYHLFQFSVATLGALVSAAGFVPGPVEHHAIDLSYSFGTLRTLLKSPRRLVYAAAFAPLAKLGPLVQQGDWFYLAARKPLAVEASPPQSIARAA